MDQADTADVKEMMEELMKGRAAISNELEPLLKSGSVENKKCRQYLETKLQLLRTYCSFISYYLMLRFQGQSSKDHPVVYKIS